MDFAERSDIVYKILKVAKQGFLDSSQKQTIYEIISRLENSTTIQIERLALYYNLKDGEKEYRLCDIGKLYNCSGNAIKFSIARAKNRLIHTKEEDIVLLKNILEECIKKYNIKFE